MPIEFTCPHCGSQTSVDERFAGQSGPCRSCGSTVTVPAGTTQPFAPMPPPRSSSSASILIVVLVCGGLGLFACAGILLALLLPAVQAAREAGRRSTCVNNLRQIAIAMHNYHDVWQTFPPAYVADENGRPKHSWRVLILPYIEQQALYNQYNFDEPWDGPGNSQLAALMPAIYGCPSDPATGPASTTTSYAAITGPGTIFDDGQAPPITSITDGTSNTIMIAEASGAGIHWMEPRDLDIDQMTFKINGSPNDISSEHPGGAQAAFADGSVRLLSSSVAAQTLRALLTKAGSEPVGGF